MLRTILKISRPRFWMYLAGPFLIGCMIAIHSTWELLTPQILLGFVYFLLPANLLIYSANDLSDEDTDKFNQKKTQKELKVTTKNRPLYVYIFSITALVSFLMFFVFHTPNASLLFLIFLMLSLGYSLKPLRFKSKPFLDSASNVLYAIPGFIGYSFLTNNFPSPTIVLSAFCWTAAMHIFSAIPDIEADTKARLKTTATVLGRNESLLLCFLLWMISAVGAISYDLRLVFGLIYPAIPFLLLTRHSEKIETWYWRFPQITAILGFFLFLIAASHLF